MPKQKIEIEVDIPDGWEFVRYGPAKKGEHYIGFEKVSIAIFDFADVACCIIVQPAWQWPAWLRSEWIAMDRNGAWYAYLDDPVLGEFQWYGPRGQLTAPSSTTEPFHWIDFAPPPCTDWRQSKRRRPLCQSSE